METTAIILARGGSKGLPGKNLALLNGVSLLERGIRYLQACNYVSRIIVSSDSQTILEAASLHGVDVHIRDHSLASDTASSISVLQSIALDLRESCDLPDFFAHIQLTEPFRPRNILSKCIEALIENPTCDSAFAALSTHKNYWCMGDSQPYLLTNSSDCETPRQSKPAIYREDTGIALAVRPEVWLNGNRIGSSPHIVPYSTLHSLIDIHSINDLKFAELIEPFIDD